MDSGMETYRGLALGVECAWPASDTPACNDSGTAAGDVPESRVPARSPLLHPAPDDDGCYRVAGVCHPRDAPGAPTQPTS